MKRYVYYPLSDNDYETFTVPCKTPGSRNIPLSPLKFGIRVEYDLGDFVKYSTLKNEKYLTRLSTEA